MSNPLVLIKNGIANGDWDSVVQGYHLMTGERLDPPPNGSISKGYIKIADLLEFIGSDTPEKEVVSRPPPPQKKTKSKKNKPSLKTQKIVEEIEEDVPPEDNIVIHTPGIVGVRKQAFKSGPVNAKGNIMEQPAANDIDPELVKKNKKAKVEKQYRAPYKADMRKCSDCETRYDFKKAYPLGKWGDSKEACCSKCQNHQTKK